jgi:hypothetical protein
MKRIVPIIFISLIALLSCSKKESCPTCPPALTDTTSHNFTWQTFMFGGAGGSQLRDVTIINDTLIYAVGEIYINDSLGHYDPLPYNLAVWNGIKWDLRKVTVNFRGNMITPPLEGIFAFSPTQIWIIGSLPIYGDGRNWVMYDLRTTLDPSISVSIGWGMNSNLMYFVGRSGSIVSYNGSSWSKIESGTSLSINDIYGAYNSTTKQWEILAVASDDVNKKILRIQGTSVSSVSDDGLSSSLNSIWFVPCEKYYVVGAGIGYKTMLDSSPWSVYPSGVVTSYTSGGVRGNNINDVFVAGSFFEIVHYNGSSWHNYNDVIPYTDGAVGRIAVKGNLVVTVGLSGQNAIAIIGKR